VSITGVLLPGFREAHHAVGDAEYHVATKGEGPADELVPALAAFLGSARAWSAPCRPRVLDRHDHHAILRLDVDQHGCREEGCAL
jgi:hypothetical protein